MIIVLKDGAQKKDVENLVDTLKTKGLDIHYSQGESTTIIGLIGDTTRVDPEAIAQLPAVGTVKRVSEPFKLANRKFHVGDTEVKVGASKIGGGTFGVIAGPCSVESERQLFEIAEKVKKSGACFLRGGAFKPRTSPYSFRGLKAEGIELLIAAKKQYKIPVVSELTSLDYIDLYQDVDIIQVGARNMQNFDMLLELGHSKKPVLLKRGLSSTIEELLMSAEYILAGGNANVILCERGIRTFETMTRNTLDISAVPVLKKITHLPVMIDPSHSGGRADIVPQLSKCAVVAGGDGLIVEVHNCPACALCDGAQSITPDTFDGLMTDIRKLCEMEGKRV